MNEEKKTKIPDQEIDPEEGQAEEKARGTEDTTSCTAKKISPESDIYCPHCGQSSAQQEDEPIIESNRIYLPMYCHMCESTWQCHFDLSGHTEVNTPPEYAGHCQLCDQCFTIEEVETYKYDHRINLCIPCHKKQIQYIEGDRYYAIYYKGIDEWDKEPRIVSSSYLWEEDATLMETLSNAADPLMPKYNFELSFDKYIEVMDTSGYLHKVKKLTKEEYERLKDG
jgi:hypothetical protein